MLNRFLFWLFPSLNRDVLALINSAIELERKQCAQLAKDARTQYTLFGDFPTMHGSIIAAQIEARSNDTANMWAIVEPVEIVTHKSSFNEILAGMTL